MLRMGTDFETTVDRWASIDRMRETGVSDAEIARRLGVNRSSVHRVAAGRGTRLRAAMDNLADAAAVLAAIEERLDAEDRADARAAAALNASAEARRRGWSRGRLYRYIRGVAS